MVGGTGKSRRQVVKTVELPHGLPTDICSQAGKHQNQNRLAKPAQQSVHLTLGILRKSQAVFHALSFFWLDGFAVRAPAYPVGA